VAEQWKTTEANYDYEKMMADWKLKADEAKAAGKPAPRAPSNQLTGNQRPGNIWAGVLHPTIGYGIRGTIWYQGESNTGRAYQYDEVFALMRRMHAQLRTSFLIVTHDPRLAARCDRVIELRDGSVERDGSVVTAGPPG
jgi:hypothetical protein